MSNHRILVEKAGGMVITVDRGRQGAQASGLTESGAMDEHALLWVNALLENAPTAAALEIGVGQLQLRFTAQATIALTGAQRQVLLNGKAMPMWCSFRVAQDDVLTLSWPGRGIYSYLAISGGFFVPLYYQSACCVVREQLGGYHGRVLQAGDILPHHAQKTIPLKAVPYRFQRDYGQPITGLRVLCCYQYPLFTRQAVAQFFQQVYRVSGLTDRMGYRLTGDAIAVPAQGIISEGIALGSIQIASEGQPIVLMRDRQTIGGYPKIGTLFSTDVEKLAQLAAGSQLRFIPANLEDVLEERQQREQFFANRGK